MRRRHCFDALRFWLRVDRLQLPWAKVKVDARRGWHCCSDYWQCCGPSRSAKSRNQGRDTCTHSNMHERLRDEDVRRFRRKGGTPHWIIRGIIDFEPRRRNNDCSYTYQYKARASGQGMVEYHGSLSRVGVAACHKKAKSTLHHPAVHQVPKLSHLVNQRPDRGPSWTKR